MRLLPPSRLSSLLSLIFFYIALAVASSDPLRYTVAYSPVSSTSKPIPCAVIIGTPVTHNSPAQPDKVITRLIWSIESYTPPRKENEEWARIGLLDASGKAFNGSTSLASVAALKEPELHAAELYVQLDADKLPETVSVRQVQTPKDKAPGKDVGKPRLLVMTSAPEPRPVLNRPVVLNAEGRVDEPPKEKTLLQKYWWVGAILIAMTMMGGGESK